MNVDPTNRDAEKEIKQQQMKGSGVLSAVRDPESQECFPKGFESSGKICQVHVVRFWLTKWQNSPRVVKVRSVAQQGYDVESTSQTVSRRDGQEGTGRESSRVVDVEMVSKEQQGQTPKNPTKKGCG